MASSWTHALVLVLVLSTLQAMFFKTFAKSKVYIVYMGDKGDKEPELVQESHHDFLSKFLGSKEAAKNSILYSYKHGLSGFAAILSNSQAKRIADSAGVVRVIQNRILSLQTTRSWDFLRLQPHIPNGILSNSHFGSGTIIGVLDTGVWPESGSFKDDGLGKVTSRWRGICQEGEEFNQSHCNRKIIGARWYIKGYEAEFGKLKTGDGIEYLSPRDAGGHGTHTSSTAAGAPVDNASFQGLAKGLARGGAPLAWLAFYKVCWATGGCSSADILAAFDDAISDGVDVLSVSIGTPPPLDTYVDDPISIGSFHAVVNGISVVCSAGNSGPYPQTVINTAPWVVTVAASTIDRAFPTSFTLGNNQTLQGQALYTGRNVDDFYPVVFGEDIAATDADEEAARSCDSGTLNATLARGKVILCFQSRSQRSSINAGRTVLSVGGVGLIFAQFPTKDVSMSVSLPCILVDFTMGTSVLTYIGSNRNPIVKFSSTRTAVGQQIAPEVAFFSSRGPSSLSPTILKPDIAAPGVNILASWSPAASSLSGEESNNVVPSLDFKIDTGTSMACPHISGIVALIKAVHPKWSPAAIKSALVTTACTEDVYSQNIIAESAPHKVADPFDYGGGHVDPNKAIDPGLIYDMGVKDYVGFLCSMGYNNSAISSVTMSPTTCRASSTNFLLNLNLPSVTIPELKQTTTVTRTVTNVGPVMSIYTSRIQSPPGIYVTVEPRVLSFDSTITKIKFRLTFRSQFRVQGRYSFGNLFWEDGFHVVRIPLIVRAVIDSFLSET